MAGRLFSVAVVLAVGVQIGCGSGPTSCEAAACDAESQYCVFFGTDTLAPPKASCWDYPELCAAEPTCECLLEEHEAVATCEEGPDGFRVTIPGG